MSIPTGYEKLAVIGIAWKNEYVQGTAYKTMNAVYYNGSTYVALRDNPTGPPAADGANWQYLAKGFEQQLLSAITALDTSGVLGQAGATVGGQALMDAIADKVMTKLIAKSQIVNNLLATEPGNVLDATQGKALKDDITELYSDLGERVYYSDNVIALQSPVVNNVTYRFQVDSRSGGVILYKSEDNGINWTRNKEILSNADIQKGRVAALSCPANTITDHKLVFPKAFTVAPRVMLTLNSSTESPKYGSALPFTTNITSTGCTIRVANNSDTTFSPNIEWFAIAL